MSEASGQVVGSGPVLRPSSWRDAMLLRSKHPDASPICGGTDLMVAINFGRARPAALLDLTSVEGIDSWELIEDGRMVRIGAGVCFTRIIDELSGLCPALAQAARTVGSPQIRNRGTVAGNLATASPAGDSHPVLLACRARVEAESVRGSRLIDIDDFFVGPKRSALAPDELIRAVRIRAATGPQQFAKVGPRNAMVIATASFALNLDVEGRRVGTGIGSAGPTPLRARAAEQMLEEALADRWGAPGRRRRGRGPSLRRPGRGGCVCYRRCARHRRIPDARAVGARPALPGWALAEMAEQDAA